MTTWDEIVRANGPPTYGTAWKILGHAQDCEDVMQDVFVEAHKLYVKGNVRNWPAMLKRMATFRALDLLRLRKAVDSIEGLPITDPSPGPQALAIRHEDEVRLQTLVAELPPRQAAVFCLRYFDELSHDEIATALEISLNAVAIALHKARVSLRDGLSSTYITIVSKEQQL